MPTQTMNHLLIGDADKTERFLELAQPPFLLLADGPIVDAFLDQFPEAKLFDISRHRFNPLQGMNHKRARALARALYSYEEDSGKTTLTVRNGKRAFTQLALTYDYLRKFKGDTKKPDIAEALAMRDDILLSPDLTRIFGHTPNFTIDGSIIVALDSPQLDEFDAYVLATTLLLRFQGQVIVPDFGFYGRDFYMSLIRQNRLICGLEFLAELPLKLQQSVIKIRSKTIYRTTPEDAARLVVYTRHTEPKTLSTQTGKDHTDAT